MKNTNNDFCLIENITLNLKTYLNFFKISTSEIGLKKGVPLESRHFSEAKLVVKDGITSINMSGVVNKLLSQYTLPDDITEDQISLIIERLNKVREYNDITIKYPSLFQFFKFWEANYSSFYHTTIGKTVKRFNNMKKDITCTKKKIKSCTDLEKKAVLEENLNNLINRTNHSEGTEINNRLTELFIKDMISDLKVIQKYKNNPYTEVSKNCTYMFDMRRINFYLANVLYLRFIQDDISIIEKLKISKLLKDYLESTPENCGLKFFQQERALQRLADMKSALELYNVNSIKI